MKQLLDMDKIAGGVGGERRGTVNAKAGYFGAIQLLADVEERLSVPSGGGRRTDPKWTERRLLPLAPETLRHLEELSKRIRKQRGITIAPMQLAALLLEKTAQDAGSESAGDLVEQRETTTASRRKRRMG